MDKIDAFTITGLTVEGFKCFADKQSFDFGGVTAITGHNGLGKSSIADAIAYAISGVPFFGDSSLDRLYTLESKNITVELDIQTADGAAHKLTRSRANDVTTVSFDGVTVRQTDLADMFGEKDVFLSIFNPLYFIETLGDKGRNLLERHLPAIPHEAVMDSMSEGYRVLLENENMPSPEAFLERIRSDIREIEDTIIYAEGQRDLLESQEREKTQALQKTREAIAPLEERRTQGINLTEMQHKLDDLYAQHDELSHDVLSAPDTSEVDEKILTAQTALAKREADVYISKFAQSIAETNATIASLREQYSRETAILNGLTPGIRCPMCKQDITEDNIDSVKKAFSDSIAEIIAKGSDLTAKLADLNALDEKTKSMFEQFKSEDMAKLEAELTALRAARAAIFARSGEDAEARRHSMDELKGKIQTLELDMKNGSLDPAEVWELEGLNKDRERLEAEIAAMATAEPSASASGKATNIESLREKIKQRREVETAVKIYIAERNRLMFSEFDTLSRVSIVLIETVKTTGEVRDVFKFSYDGKPYKYLSLSEKIKAGLEVSELMNRLTGKIYPVFVDNGESVPVIDNVRPSGQVLIAQVAKGAPLKVEIIGGAVAGNQQAA